MPDTQLLRELDTEAFVKKETENWWNYMDESLDDETLEEYLDRRLDERASQRGHY